MLARDYEEAVALYERYGKNMLGVISDVSFKREGVKDSKAVSSSPNICVSVTLICP